VISKAPANAVPLELVRQKHYRDWIKKQPKLKKRWMETAGLSGKPGKFVLIPHAETGALCRVVAVVENKLDVWALSGLPRTLPELTYQPEVVAGGKLSDGEWEKIALGWQLGCYSFEACKGKPSKKQKGAKLVVPAKHLPAAMLAAEATCLARDLVNRPANDLTPVELANAAKKLAKEHEAKCMVIKGDALLQKNYPLIHAVGRASDNPPCLVDMQWGNAKHPKVTLVGKGISFDSGGLDMKSAVGMKLMKKDMGGAAQVLGIAHMIMSAKLPVRLRVLIPAAENSVSGKAFRPSDVIKSRKGITVEIGNTDAEGRLVLSDALAEADSEKPELIIDCATLTGAARIALGTELPAFFTPDDKLAAEVEKAGEKEDDHLWRMPLWKPYRSMLNSGVADINNIGGSGYGGAITAALYLHEFVEHTRSWIHVDLMAWNTRARPGRPVGGEAMGLRALYALIASRYGKK
ncbi:MAG: leucyl aminopeptidase family protein, partial [Rickettsiales bacterium]